MASLSFPPRLTANLALFLDFDGTLAPIQDDPETVTLPEGGDATLNAMSNMLGGALAIVSGRSLADLSVRVPLGLWRAGTHGLDIRAPEDVSEATNTCAPAELSGSIEALVNPLDGVRIERKGAVLAIHFRAAPHHGDQLETDLAQIVQRVGGYTLQRGKMVFEAKPAAANKGRAIETLMAVTPFIGRTPVMVGDDTTDEDAMAAVQSAGGWAVKVGTGESLASHRLETPNEVWTWLRQPL